MSRRASSRKAVSEERAALLKRKALLRREALARRDALSPEERARKSLAIAHRLLSLAQWEAAGAVLGYMSFRSEVETPWLLARALAEGKQVALPRVDDRRRGLDVCWVTSLDELCIEPGTWGILEPVPSRCEMASPEDVDIILVPGAAFDAAGGRVGYGGGFYDRLLRSLEAPQRENAIALAFEEQFVAEVPMGRYDLPVAAIVTDERVIFAGR